MTEGSSSEFGTKKINFLKQCVRITEDLLSSTTDAQKIPKLIQQRGEVISLLTELEKTPVKGATPSENVKVDQLINLLQKLDRQVAKKIKNEQQNILAALKVNSRGFKLTAYNSNSTKSTGRFIDKKR
jgi:hypothetical protein